MFGFGALNNDFDYDGDFDFTKPVDRPTSSSATSKQTAMDDQDLNDPAPHGWDAREPDWHESRSPKSDPPKSRPPNSEPPRSQPSDSDPHDFWKHEPTRSLPRVGSRRKPSGRAGRAASASRSTYRSRTRSRAGANRQHGETQQIPVIDDDGVIILDDTACRPFDAATGLGGRNPGGRARTHQRSFGAENNPLLRRVGAMMVILALGVPVAMALRGGDSGRASLGLGEAAAMAAAQDSAATVAVSVDASVQTETPLVTETAAVTEAAADSVAAETAAVVTAAAEQAVQAAAPVCVKTYTVALGDGWLRIADAHGVALNELLASNAATVSTFLLVGSTICVPANAHAPTTTVKTTTPAVTTPAAAVYVAPFSLPCPKTYVVVLGDGWLRIANKHNVAMKDLLKANAASSSTFLMIGKKICVPANATAPTTPTTVKVKVVTKTTRPPPTPTINPPTRTYTAAEVEAIIREIWPDDLEDEAVRIAKRESHLNPRAQNYCCYGLFQIYFNVHKKWLGEMGITSGEMLLDPYNGAKAGLKLYQRNGWGPWKL